MIMKVLFKKTIWFEVDMQEIPTLIQTQAIDKIKKEEVKTSDELIDFLHEAGYDPYEEGYCYHTSYNLIPEENHGKSTIEIVNEKEGTDWTNEKGKQNESDI